MTPLPRAEFDAHADGYDGGIDNALKALAGDSPEAFIAVRQRWLVRRWPDLATDPALANLDYGCGSATLLRLLRAAGVPGRMTGTDVSSGMLREAVRVWPSHSAPPAFRLQNGPATALPDAAFDLIVISAVLHHVPPNEHGDVYRELFRVARPGARLVVFEHNPWDPVTRFVVARTPIDAGAVLLAPPEVAAGLATAGWRGVRTSHLMFLPPRLGVLATATERVFGWLPMGGQYAVTAGK